MATGKTISQRVKELVKGQVVDFQYYTQGELWYMIDGAGQVNDFYFPVPVADAGNATFLKQDKAILFMRYIRKHVEMLDATKADSQGEDCERVLDTK